MSRRCSMNGLVTLVAAFALLGLVAAPSAQATTYTWDNGNADGLWTSPTDWAPNHNAVPGAGDTATLGGATTPGAVDLNGTAQTVGTVSLENAAGSYTLQNGTLGLNLIQQTAAVTGTNTISANLTATSASAGVVANIAGGTLNLTGTATGFSGGLTKNGAGTLVLSATNGYTGATVINGGILQLGAANALPAQPLAINGSAFDLGGYNDTITTLALNAGSVIDSGPAATLTLGGDVASTGASATAGGAAINLGGSNRTFTVTGNLNLQGALTGNYTMTKAGAGSVILGNASTNVAGVYVSAGSLVAGASGMNLGYLNQAAGTFINLGAYNVNTTFAGPTTTNTGTILLSGGTLTVGSLNATDTANIYLPLLMGNGTLAKTGTGLVQIDPHYGSWAGAIQVNGGTLVGYSSTTNMWPMFDSLYVASGATFTKGNNNQEQDFTSLTGTGTINCSWSAGTFFIGVGMQDQSFIWGGNISSTGGGATVGINKFGMGTMTITNTNSFTNDARFYAGTVSLDSSGALPSMGTVTMYNGTLNLINTAVNNTNRINDNSNIQFNASGAINLIGSSGGASSETIKNVTLAYGGSSIGVTSNNILGATLNLGTYARTANDGGWLDINLVNNAGTANVKFNQAPTNGILPGMTIGTDWATNGGVNTVTSAYASYSAFATSGSNATQNQLLTGSGTLVGSSTAYTLKINTNNSGQSLNLAGYALTLSAPGLLFVGSQDYTISSSVGSGNLGNTSGNPEVLIINKGSGKLNINVPISSGTGITAFAGTGITTLNVASTATGKVYIDSGTVKLGTINAISSATTDLYIYKGATLDLNGQSQVFTNQIYLSGGTIVGTGNSVLNNGSQGTLAFYYGYSEIDVATINLGHDYNFNGNLAGDSLLISSSITGGYGFYCGSGTVTLTGSSNYTGNGGAQGGGIVIAKNNAALGSSTTGNFTISTNGELRIEDNNGTPTNLNHTIYVNGTGVKPVNAATAYQWGALRDTSGNNTISGQVSLQSGTANYIGVDPGLTLTITGQLTANNGNSRAFTKVGAGTLVLTNNTNNWGLGNITSIIQGTLQLGASNVVPDTNDIQVAAGATFNVNGMTEVIRNFSDYNGSGGTLALGSGGALTITDSGAAYTFSGNITGTSATLTVAGNNTLTLAGSSTYTGTANVNTGATLSLASANALGAGVVVNTNSGTVSVGLDSTIGAISGAAGTITNAGTYPTILTLGAAGGSYTQSSGALISGNLSLIKNGAYTQTLSASNTYTGGTILNAGQLILSNTNTAASAVGTGDLILNGGTLANNGTTGSLSGNLISGAAAHTISPGGHSAIGTLTVGGNLNLNGNATLDFSNITNSSNMDRINVAGSLNFSGSGTTTLLLPMNLAPNTYKLVDYHVAGNVVPGDFSLASNLLGYTVQVDGINNDLDVQVVADYWQGASGDSWAAVPSWAAGVPNFQGAPANFTGLGGANVNVDNTVTVGVLNFDGAQSYNIQAGAGTPNLAFDNTGVASTAAITMTGTAAAQTISVPMSIVNTDLVVTNSSTNTLTISGPVTGTGRNLTLTAGELDLTNTGDTLGSLTLQAGTLGGGGSIALGTGANLQSGALAPP